jgi:putative protease
LSVEDDANNLAAHLSALTVDERAKIRAILYKDTPLFLAEACSLTALHDGCPTSKVCGYRTLEIENEKGERFYVAHEGCKSVVYGKNAYSITDQCAKLSQLSISTFRIDCITRPYSDDDVKRISQAAATSKGLGGTHSANFHRELL